MLPHTVDRMMTNIELFAKRFNELSADLGKTHRELADELQINLHDIIRWSSGKNNYLPSVGKLLIFANYFPSVFCRLLSEFTAA